MSGFRKALILSDLVCESKLGDYLEEYLLCLTRSQRNTSGRNDVPLKYSIVFYMCQLVYC